MKLKIIFLILFYIKIESVICTELFLENEYVQKYEKSDVDFDIFYVNNEQDFLFVGGVKNMMKFDLKNITDMNQVNTYDLISYEKNNFITKFDIIIDMKLNESSENFSQLLVSTTSKISNSINWIIYKNVSLELQSNSMSMGFLECSTSIKYSEMVDLKKNSSDETFIQSTLLSSHSKPDNRSNSCGSINSKSISSYSIAGNLFSEDNLIPDNTKIVNSYIVDDQLLFFFQENLSSNEYEKKIFKIARICKINQGSFVQQIWKSLLKIDLICPSFNQMESIYKISGDDSYFYGLFSSSTDSGICAFHIDDINKAFYSKIMEIYNKQNNIDKTINLTLINENICNNNISKYESIINDNNDLNSTVNGRLVYIFKNNPLKMTNLVVDKIKRNDNESDVEYTIYYVQSGPYISKIVEWIDMDKLHTELRDGFSVASFSGKIISMEISKKYQSLYIATTDVLIQIDLKMCKRIENSCVFDPYCEWVSNTDENICIKSPTTRVLTDLPETTILYDSTTLIGNNENVSSALLTTDVPENINSSFNQPMSLEKKENDSSSNSIPWIPIVILSTFTVSSAVLIYIYYHMNVIGTYDVRQVP